MKRCLKTRELSTEMKNTEEKFIDDFHFGDGNSNSRLSVRIYEDHSALKW
jgi:hypothetical protein